MGGIPLPIAYHGLPQTMDHFMSYGQFISKGQVISMRFFGLILSLIQSISVCTFPDDWGHGGCFECAEPEAFNQTDILMARFHLANIIETDLNLIPEKYETQI